MTSYVVLIPPGLYLVIRDGKRIKSKSFIVLIKTRKKETVSQNID